MRRFQFRLERLLWHRRCREELAQQALAGALTRERELAVELSRIQRQAAEEAVRLRATLARPTVGTEVLLHARFASGLTDRQVRLAGRREEVLVAVEERRRSLRECWRAREALTRLRARALARYQEAVEREAQLVLDEVAGIRHARRGGERLNREGADVATAE